jgi:hypothetical protein
MNDSAAYAPWLWFITILMTGRVFAQLLVVVARPRWLPPQGEQWMSGVMPYRWLLPAQLVVLVTMTWVSIDYTRGSGVFFQPHPRWAGFWLGFSYLYLGGMVARYIVRMRRRPDQRWFGGTIPIIFHSLMAAFLWIAAWFHVARL